MTDYTPKLVEHPGGTWSIQSPDGAEFAVVFDLGLGFPVAKDFAAKAAEAPAMYEALKKLDNSLDEVPGDLWGEVEAILERIDND